MTEYVLHPIQAQTRDRKPATLSSLVTLKAYEVYCHVYGEQPALVTGWCRGGFSSGEVIAFLYAHTFPRNQWRDRVQEAFKGMNL